MTPRSFWILDCGFWIWKKALPARLKSAIQNPKSKMSSTHVVFGHSAEQAAGVLRDVGQHLDKLLVGIVASDEGDRVYFHRLAGRVRGILQLSDLRQHLCVVPKIAVGQQVDQLRPLLERHLETRDRIGRAGERWRLRAARIEEVV